jgi:hypothetical protein
MGWMRSIYLWESAIQRLAFHPTLASFELANAVTKAAAVAVGEETLSRQGVNYLFEVALREPIHRDSDINDLLNVIRVISARRILVY